MKKEDELELREIASRCMLNLEENDPVAEILKQVFITKTIVRDIKKEIIINLSESITKAFSTIDISFEGQEIATNLEYELLADKIHQKISEQSKISEIEEKKSDNDLSLDLEDLTFFKKIHILFFGGGK